MKYKKILIAVDDSPLSMRAAQSGFALAHGLNAVIGLLYVINKTKEVVNADIGITPQESKTILLSEASKTLEQYIKMYNGVESVFSFTPEGLPEQEIVRTAKEWGADLIVMGTHGKTVLSRILTGSTAEYVIRHSEIPVLIVPPNMK